MGAAVLVAGITFIGGYTGLRMSPFYRSLMIVGAAATLGAGSYVLAHKERWVDSWTTYYSGRGSRPIDLKGSGDGIGVKLVLELPAIDGHLH